MVYKKDVIKKINREDVIKGINYCFLNSLNIYNESLFLNENGFRTRALFLLAISLEELGKIFIIIDSYRNPIEINKFKFKFSEFQGNLSHPNKLYRAIFQSVIANKNIDLREVVKKFEKFSNEMKQLAIKVLLKLYFDK